MLLSGKDRSDDMHAADPNVSVDMLAMETTDDEGQSMVGGRGKSSSSLAALNNGIGLGIPMAEPPRDYSVWMWIAFASMGAINNFSYCLVGSAAQSLAEQFNQVNLIGVITWANVGFGVLTKSINTAYFLKSAYGWRIYLTGLLMGTGLLIVALSVYASFWMSIAGILLIGSFSAFGESVILAYLKYFHVNLMGAFSSGTGIAGIAGTGLYLAFASANLDNMTIFLICMPTTLIYCIAYFYSYKVHYYPKVVMARAARTPAFTNSNPMLLHSNEMILDPLMVRGREESVAFDVFMENKTSMADIRRVWSIIWKKSVLLMLVYYFEYVCQSGFAAVSCSNAKHAYKARGQPVPWLETQAYVLLQFAYQIGVFISRSSIQIVQIKQIWVMTLLQGINYAIWWTQATHDWMPIGLQLPFMVYVGLLGGAMYVNVFAIIKTQSPEEGGVEHKDKELAVNLIAIGNIVGITAASLWELMMNNTFMPNA